MKLQQPIKARPGMNVRLTHAPGLWQCMDKSPKPGGWWMLAVDDEAREHGHFEEATWRTMRPADWNGIDG